MGSLLERLEAREAAVRTRVEALRAEMADVWSGEVRPAPHSGPPRMTADQHGSSYVSGSEPQLTRRATSRSSS